MEIDVFISHAHEDKESFVRPLVAELLKLGLTVWYDETALELGDSLRRKIEEGLGSCSYGVVVLSNAFFRKNWPKKELDGLAVRENGGKKVILPIYHGITVKQVEEYSPILADRMATSSSKGARNVAREIFAVVRRKSPPSEEHSARVMSELMASVVDLAPTPTYDPHVFVPDDVLASDIRTHEETVTAELVVRWHLGMHARPCALICKTATAFRSRVRFERFGEIVDGKSVMGLMMLAAGCGARVIVTAEGTDARACIAALIELFRSDFQMR